MYACIYIICIIIIIHNAITIIRGTILRYTHTHIISCIIPSSSYFVYYMYLGIYIKPKGVRKKFNFLGFTDNVL